MLCLVALSGSTSRAGAEQRLAMVVGIDRYANLGGDAQLQRAVSDADSVSESLRKLGYTVTTLAHGQPVTQLFFLKAFRTFAEAIRPGDTVVFYFAGHGVDVAGNNLLIPADIPSFDEMDGDGLQVRAIQESSVRRMIDERRPGVALLMLDACRNDPFKSPDRAFGTTRGLQPIEAPRGMMTIYAASAGQTALDRLPADDSDPNSVFTRVVLRELARPGINIVEFSEDVRDQVEALARSVNHDQVPAVESNLFKGRAIFIGGTPPAAPPPADEVAWSLVQGTADAATLRRFVDQFPQSPRKTDATARLAALESTVPPPPSAPPAEAARPAPDDEAWARLPATADPVEIRTFMIRFPRSHLLGEAEKRLAVAREEALWVDAVGGDPVALREYQFLYPQGAHKLEAEKRLAMLNPASGPLPEPSPAPAADGEAEWRVAAAATTPDPVRQFLARFPRSTLRPEAEARLRSLDEELWARVRGGDAAAQRRYLSSFASGVHQAEARARIATLEAPVRGRPIQKAEPEPSRHPVPLRRIERPAPVARERHIVVERSEVSRPSLPHRVERAATVAPSNNRRCFAFGGDNYCQ